MPKVGYDRYQWTIAGGALVQRGESLILPCHRECAHSLEVHAVVNCHCFLSGHAFAEQLVAHSAGIRENGVR
jgi:hypothetical protein